jgi:hypothetical protein
VDPQRPHALLLTRASLNTTTSIMLGLLRPLLAAALAAAAAALPASRSASMYATDISPPLPPTDRCVRSSTLGYLQVSAGHSVTGYVSRSQNSYGEYKGVSPDTDHSDVSHRLIVSFDLSANGSTNLLASVRTCSYMHGSAYRQRAERAGQRLPVLRRVRGRPGL